MSLTDDTRDLIEKMAEYVAINGVQYENMTRQRQVNNPKYSFMNPSDGLNSYYRGRVNYHRSRNPGQQQQQAARTSTYANPMLANLNPLQQQAFAQQQIQQKIQQVKQFVMHKQQYQQHQQHQQPANDRALGSGNSQMPLVSTSSGPPASTMPTVTDSAGPTGMSYESSRGDGRYRAQTPPKPPPQLHAQHHPSSVAAPLSSSTGHIPQPAPPRPPPLGMPHSGAYGQPPRPPPFASQHQQPSQRPVRPPLLGMQGAHQHVPASTGPLLGAGSTYPPPRPPPASFGSTTPMQATPRGTVIGAGMTPSRMPFPARPPSAMMRPLPPPPPPHQHMRPHFPPHAQPPNRPPFPGRGGPRQSLFPTPSAPNVEKADFKAFEAIFDTFMVTGDHTHMQNVTYWILEHCTTPIDIQKATVFLENALIGEANRGEHDSRMKPMYIAHDLLYHATRLGKHRLRDSILAAVPAMFHALMHYSDQGRSDVVELLGIWEEDEVVTTEDCRELLAQASEIVPPRPLSSTISESVRKKKFYDLPASCMMDLIQDDNDFDSVDPYDMRPKTPTNDDAPQDVMEALQAFFSPNADKLTADGWERGALDSHYEKEQRHSRRRRSSDDSRY